VETDNQRFNATVQPNSAFLAELKEKLPEFFTRDNSFDLEKFQAALKEKNVSELSEGYQLNFIGKDYARRQAGEMPTTVIVPDEDQNNGAGKNSQNLFFTGDNLEVLRHLQNNYQNKIDVIYIDPPYNTGSDGFVYPDSFEYSDDKLKEMFGMNDDQVARLKSIQGKASHSAWLTFMYPRLALAKRLLKENGIIFTSIDQNEYSDLEGLYLELYGESNRLYPLIWKLPRGINAGIVAKAHEYILIFSKNQDKLSYFNTQSNDVSVDRTNKKIDSRHPLSAITFPAGIDYEGPDQVITGKIDGNEEIFIEGKMIFKKGKLTQPVTLKAGWTMKNFIEKWLAGEKVTDTKGQKIKRFFFKKNGKLYSEKEKNVGSVKSILNGVGDNQNARDELAVLFGTGDIFDSPKPSSLIKKLLSLSTNSNSTVLDFFAGSSTTADAVMQLNAEDGGHRKFIMVQLPEKTYHTNSDGSEVPTKGGKAAYEAGFRSIDEISRERIRRAAAKIKADNELTLPADFDGSFKHYRVVKPSRMTLDQIEEFKPETDELVLDTVNSFSSQTLGVAGNASGEQTVLATWLAKDGYPFDVDVQKIDLAGYQGNLIENNRLYLIRENWNSQSTEKLLNLLGTHALNLQAVVIFGYSFNLNDLRELENGLKQLDGNVSLIKRY
jgi:adenine-specific DNA-methyltransferase